MQSLREDKQSRKRKIEKARHVLVAKKKVIHLNHHRRVPKVIHARIPDVKRRYAKGNTKVEERYQILVASITAYFVLDYSSSRSSSPCLEGQVSSEWSEGTEEITLTQASS
jgi:hypothetical protein